jgi:nucleoside-diphosphate-sugar epimerase
MCGYNIEQNYYFRRMILVTGGTGLLGSHLLYRLVSDGHRVKALKRKNSSIALTEKIFSYYAKDILPLTERIEWVEGDLHDIYSLLDALQGVETLYHAAAAVSLDTGDDSLLLETNVQGTANIVNAAIEQKVKKMCYVSTIGALGYEADHKMIDEETPWDASSKKSAYSVSKYEAEREVWRGMAEGLEAVIVNPGVIIGPGDWQEGSPRLFSTVYHGLKFYPRGTNGFVDVNDVVTAMLRLTENDVTGERFTVVSENVAYRQLFAWMAEVMNVPAPKYRLGKVIGEIGWRVAETIAFMTGNQPAITRDAVRSSGRFYAYSSKKLLETINMELMPVKDSVERTAKLFLEEI